SCRVSYPPSSSLSPYTSARSSCFTVRRLPPSTLFPTRRSSDLVSAVVFVSQSLIAFGADEVRQDVLVAPAGRAVAVATGWGYERSEEHTSELQSRFDLVCRLLLEKKNITTHGVVRIAVTAS